MNVLFAIFAMIYAAIGISTLWMPFISACFFFFFGLSLLKTFTHSSKPAKAMSKLSYKK